MSADDGAAPRRTELLALLQERRRETETRYRQALEQQLSGAAAGDSEGVHGWKASYGSCASCWEPIPIARLRAVPFATLCVPCQARSEATGDRGRRGKP